LVERALATLTPGQREIVLLRDVEGFNNEEIAAILGWTVKPGALRKRIFDAREAFRKAMIEVGYSE
jgi:DNA-directed RNA polymerase specialized sigma24 family protein